MTTILRVEGRYLNWLIISFNRDQHPDTATMKERKVTADSWRPSWVKPDAWGDLLIAAGMGDEESAVDLKLAGMSDLAIDYASRIELRKRHFEKYGEEVNTIGIGYPWK